MGYVQHSIKRKGEKIMQQITALQFFNALLDRSNKHFYNPPYKTKCGHFFSQSIQVDCKEFEYVELRFNDIDNTTHYYGSK